MKRIFKIFMLALLALTVCAVVASCASNSAGTGSSESTDSTGNPSTPNKPVNEEAFTSATVTETNTDGRADAEITELSVGFLTEETYNHGNYAENSITKTTYASTLSASYMVIDLKIKTLENIENKSVKVMARVSDGPGMSVIVEDAPTGKVESVENPDGSKSYDLIYSLPKTAGMEKSVRMILKFLSYAGGEVSVDVSVSGIDGATVKGKTNASTPFLAPSHNLDFKLMDDGTYSVRGTKSSTHNLLFIPPFLNDVPVTSIDEHAFSDSANLTNVTISDNVTSIGDYAFYNCLRIKNIIVSNSVTSIGKYAFSRCYSLMNIVIPENVPIISDSAFSDCANLTSVVISDGVTSIGNEAFAGCKSLTSITVPGSVTSIGICAFQNCGSLKNIAIPDGVTSIGNNAFAGCSDLTDITIPDSVTSIGYAAFAGCQSLSSAITIPDGITSIGDQMFHSCSSLTSITIPNSVTSIGIEAFKGCSSLTGITIPEGVTSIGDKAFYQCDSMTEISVSENNAHYSSDNGVLFDKQKTNLIRCPAGKTKTYTIPDGATSIADTAFSDCSGLTGIKIPNSVTSIGKYAFYNCSGLRSITIPDSITIIKDEAFRNCSAMKSITIPNSVNFINSQALLGCTGLTDIYYSGTTAQWKSISFRSEWNTNTGAYTVTCANGAVAKDGTVTFFDSAVSV